MEKTAAAGVDYRHPEIILQKLIQFDTTNPPGNEKDCIHFIRDLLEGAGLAVKMAGRDPGRPNLITRLKGDGSAPPLMFYGHADVVAADEQVWRYPPFGAEIADGYVWGRGALDMKGGLAMMIAALLEAKDKGIKPAGDIIFAALSDEEAGGDLGAKYLVEHHREYFSGTRFAIGEFGGTAMYFQGKRFYPIQITEKAICWLEAKITGPGGHGAIPLRGGAMAKLSRFLKQIDELSLPPHITPVTRRMIETIAGHLFFPAGMLLRQLVNPLLTGWVLKLLGNKGKSFHPMLYHTVNPTIVQGGHKINVIPSEITIQLDGRILPGFSPQDLIAEIIRSVDSGIDIRLIRHDPGPAHPDMGMYPLICDVLKENDPQGIPVPMMLAGVTDGRHFSRIGIQTYGFTPMNLPPEFDFYSVIHAADERIPVESVHFGVRTLFSLLQRYHESSFS